MKKRAVGATVEKFVWLTEEQALFYIALSKNSLRVVECKINLVKTFIAVKRSLLFKTLLPFQSDYPDIPVLVVQIPV